MLFDVSAEKCGAYFMSNDIIMNSEAKSIQPKLSVVVVAYNIERELPRTLYTLSSVYQRDISAEEFEIIVVDNGSLQPIQESIWKNWGEASGSFRLIRIDNACSSPASAINIGIDAARGEVIGVMIDGARMASPGLLHHALRGCGLYENGVVGALGWYLGFDYQRQSIRCGYNQEVEDQLLESVDWRGDGYRLFDIAAMDESSTDGWYSPVTEFNAIFMRRACWEQFSGFDERFDLPGGGLVNLDMCKRALEHPEMQTVLLWGEATFHQVHGGTSTNASMEKAVEDWELWCAQYQKIRNMPYRPPIPSRPLVYLGCMPVNMRLHYFRSLAYPSQPLALIDPPLGADFRPASWAMPEHIWNIDEMDPLERRIHSLLLQSIESAEYAQVVSACRMLRQRMPGWRSPLHLLSLVAPWFIHSNGMTEDPEDEAAVPLVRQLDALIQGQQLLSDAQDLLPANHTNNEKIETRMKNTEEKSATGALGSVVFNPASFMEPYFLQPPAPSAGHIPFGSWLVAVQRPKVFLELGTSTGIAYLAFCQAIGENATGTKAWSVDGCEKGIVNDARDALQTLHDRHYCGFSTLLRMKFEEALEYFEDGTIDLLHVDGEHSYERARDLYDSWLPKLSRQGVILLFGTNVYQRESGMHRLWADLSPDYPSLHFPHSNGMGVLLVGLDQPAELLAICQGQPHNTQGDAGLFFSALGARMQMRAEGMAKDMQLVDAQRRIDDLQQAVQRSQEYGRKLDADMAAIEQKKVLSDSARRKAEQDLLALERDKLLLIDARVDAEQELQAVYASRSWKSTAVLRAATDFARGLGGRRLVSLARRARNAGRYILRGEWGALKSRVVELQRASAREKRLKLKGALGSDVGILATAHTLFIAHALAHALQKAGINVTVMESVPPEGFVLDWYIVVCPQMFKQLPSGEKRIAFQLEQSVSSRWFTAEYLSQLEQSFAVFDYAETNLRFMEDKGIAYPHTYLVPIGGVRNYAEFLEAAGHETPAVAVTQSDVLFYGDVNAPRRQEMLRALQENFDVRIEGNLFGAALQAAVRSARVVVNIHYYEGALLETTRIYECLSLGTVVVSEESSDMHEHAVLHESSAVTFTPIGDAQAMVEAVRVCLSAQKSGALDSREAIAPVLQQSQARFEFSLYRALHALRLLTTTQWRQLNAAQTLAGDKFVLGMPETSKRREAYVQRTQPRLPEAQLFDGVRFSPGWIGCALSYQYLAQKALASGVPRLEVMEDDVCLYPDYEQRRAVVDQWLAENEAQWDVFSGLVARVHAKTRVLAVHEFQGLKFVTVDRMMSMVQNIYKPAALTVMAQWDESNTDPEINTIDSYLNANTALRVVVVLPFLVGHEEEMHSSLWGIQNTQYTSLIEQAQSDLQNLADMFERGH